MGISYHYCSRIDTNELSSTVIKCIMIWICVYYAFCAEFTHVKLPMSRTCYC